MLLKVKNILRKKETRCDKIRENCVCLKQGKLENNLKQKKKVRAEHL